MSRKEPPIKQPPDLGRDVETTTNSRRNHVWIRLLILLLLVGGLTLLFYETGLIHFFLNKKRVLAFLDSLGPWAFAGFIALQVFQVVAAPIPGEVTGILGGFLYGPFLGVLLSTIGLTLGSLLAFTLARAFGRPFVDKFVAKSTMDRFDYLLHHKGAFLVFLLFLIPGFPKDYLCYILGLGHMGLKEFLVISTVGRFLGTALLTWQGHLARERNYLALGIVIGASLLVVLLVLLLRPRIEAYIRRQHRQQQPPRD